MSDLSHFDLPGTALYSTKSNITTPTTTQDRRAARATSSSTDIFSFPRNATAFDLRELVHDSAASLDRPAAVTGLTPENRKTFWGQTEWSFCPLEGSVLVFVLDFCCFGSKYVYIYFIFFYLDMHFRYFPFPTFFIFKFSLFSEVLFYFILNLKVWKYSNLSL